MLPRGARPGDRRPAPPAAPNGVQPLNLARSNARAATRRDPVDEAAPPRARPAGDDTTVAPASEQSPEVPGRHRRRVGGGGGGSADAKPGKGPDGEGRRKRPTFWRELPLLIVVALVLTFLIQTFLAKVYVIPSGSMETTLHGCTGCNNDRVLVDKVTYRISGPTPGDVVVFRGPDSWSSEVIVEQPRNVLVRGLQQLGSLVGLAPPDEKDFVKRVIAVGGQTVQCCDSNNRVLVDGKPLVEPYIYYLPEAGPARQSAFGPVTVPAGQLWMMGDSRNNSADSRVADHGAVPVENVIGKARMIVLPFPRFGWIGTIDPQSAAVGLPAPGSDPSGSDLGAPVALGLLGVLPFATRRRRLLDGEAGLGGFLPACDASTRHTSPRR